jgi:YD repeat-containing protein
VKKQTQYLSGSHITLEFAYDEFGNKISATDENGNTTHFEYDTLLRLTKEVYPDNKNVTYTYDTFGNLATKQDPNGSIVTYVYDNFQRVIEKNITLGTDVVGTTKETFTYDEFSRLREAKTFE